MFRVNAPTKKQKLPIVCQTGIDKAIMISLIKLNKENIPQKAELNKMLFKYRVVG